MKRSLKGMLSVLFSFSVAQPGHALQLAQLTPTGYEKDIPVLDAQPVKKAAVKTGGGRLVCAGLSTQGIQKRANQHDEAISKYAAKYGVDSDIVKAVIAIESCYNPGAVSPKGAQGLMQLIPETAERFGVADSFNSAQNIHGGTRYLSWLLKRYNGDLNKALAAYNAGEGAVDKYQGIPPYDETQHYVRKVLTVYTRLSGKPVALPAVSVSSKSVGKTAGGGRVSATYAVPALKVGKPGRSGWQTNKALAPQLYKH